VIGDLGENAIDRDDHKSQISNHKSPRVALKVDCDTFIGTRDGVPRLLEILAARNLRATFFFTFGPDRSGVAIRRVFTKPGFLKKMLRSGGSSLYGFPTVVYGTLLPAPLIGKRAEEQIRSVGAAGHETGVHAWDHVAWHDGLERWPVEKIREHASRAHEEYRRIFGRPARAAAAAGWTASARSLSVEEERALLYTSNTRAGRPFYPSAQGRVFTTLEIPTTLPTLDETLAWPHLEDDEAQRSFFRQAPRGTEVHTIHAEIEGRSKERLFERILDDWIERGITFATLEELAQEQHARRDEVPVRELRLAAVPGRGGTVATGWTSQDNT
jgi:undecaprenyl phosphate-alpha-L-ara4FN deformylase